MFIELPPHRLACVEFASFPPGEPEGPQTLTLPPRGRGPRAAGEGSRLMPAARREGRRLLHASVETDVAACLTFTPGQARDAGRTTESPAP